MYNNQPQDTNASGALSQGQKFSPEHPAIDPYSIKILLFAQHSHPEAYEAFIKDLEKDNIPWSFNNAEFFARLTAFRGRMEAILRDSGTDAETLSAVVPKEVLDPLLQELDRVAVKERGLQSVFVHELVTKYVDALKNEGVVLPSEKKQELENAIGRQYETLLGEAGNEAGAQGEIQKTLESGLSSVYPDGLRGLGAVAAAKAVASEEAPALVAVGTESAAVEDAFASPAEKKGAFLALYSQLSGEKPGLRREAVRRRAEALTGRLAAFSSLLPVEGEAGSPDVTSSGVFFQSFAPPGRKGLAAAADGFLAFLPQQTRESVITAVLSRSWERAVDATTRSLGGSVVSSPPFRQAIEAGNKLFGNRPATGGLRAVQNIFLDTTGALLGAPDEAMTDFLNLARINAALPPSHKLFLAPYALPVALRQTALSAPPGIIAGESLVLRWQHFYAATVYPYVLARPGLSASLRLDFLSDVGGWVLRFGGKKATEKAGKGVVSAAAKTGAGVAIKNGITKILTSLGFKAIASAIGAAISGGTSLLVQAAAWVGGKLLGLTWGALKTAITAPSGMLMRLMSGQGASVRWQDDLPLLFAAVPVLLIVLLFIFPWFLNFPQLHETNRMAALVNGLGGGLSEEEGIPGVARIPPYNGPPPPPSSITGCPVSGGRISQCPYNSFSHSGTSAYDIAGVNHQPVRATHGGYVASYRTGIEEGQGSGFANYVRLVGSTSGGELYYTTYAHLLRVSQRVIDAYDALEACRDLPSGCSGVAAAYITPGTVLGWVNHTGFSTGPHLHYQYNGPGAFSLPIGCAGFDGTCRAN